MKDMADRAAWLEKTIGPLTRGLERAYDEVIEKQEKELKRRDDEYQKELKKGDEHRQILSGHIDKHVIENAYLLEKNARLKYQLEKQGSSSTKPTEQTDGSDGGAHVSVDDYRHLTDKYNELMKKHQEASQRLKYVERKNVVLAQQNKGMKESMRAWQKYSDHLENKERLKSEARLTAGPQKLPVADDRDVARPSLVGMERSSPAPMISLAPIEPPLEKLPTSPVTNIPSQRHDIINTTIEMRESSDELQFQEQALELAEQTMGYKATAVAVEQAGSYKLTSSQTTEDEIATQHLSKQEQTVADQNDDLPQFVSERSLKRKRVVPTQFDIYADRVPSDGSPINPYRVKEEQNSSPPPSMAAHALLRRETMDLDIVGPNTTSNPLQRRRQPQSTHSNPTGILRHQRSTSDPLLIKTEVTKQHHYITNNDLSVQRSVEGGGLIDDEVRALSEPSDARVGIPQVLRQLDPNVQTAGQVEQAFSNKRRKKELEKFQMLTESGEDLPPVDENGARIPPSVARARFNKRLQASKKARSPSKPTHKSPAAVQGNHAAQVPTPPSSSNRPVYTPSSRKDALLDTGNGPTEKAATDARSGTREATKSASRPWQLQLRKDPSPENRPTSRKQAASKPTVRLRDKPKSELMTSDFKANPAYNHGYSYAFAETVRKRADRACLPGCTKPECCGSTFRILASAGGPLSSYEEEKLLKDFLGDAYDSMNMTQMSSEDRKELILQARTRQMSSKHGRHKQMYERAVTPPGFWRIDFPTTQEDMEDRKKIAELERRVVDERWLEAQRKGGRWMFRDE